MLRKWEADYSPKTPDEDPHPRFLEAIQKKDYMGYLLDTFLDSSTEKQDQWIAEHTAEISAIEGRVNIMADKPTNRERLQQSRRASSRVSRNCSRAKSICATCP